MKTFCAKVLVRSKPNIRDVKSNTCKNAIDSFMPIENLSCITGTYYLLKFDASCEAEALHIVEKIARELLSNEDIEVYEIKALGEDCE